MPAEATAQQWQALSAVLLLLLLLQRNTESVICLLSVVRSPSERDILQCSKGGPQISVLSPQLRKCWAYIHVARPLTRRALTFTETPLLQGLFKTTFRIVSSQCPWVIGLTSLSETQISKCSHELCARQWHLHVVYIPRSLFVLSHLRMHIHTELDTLEWRQPMSSLGILDHFPTVHRFQNLLCGIMAITPWCRVLGSRKGWARKGP